MTVAEYLSHRKPRLPDFPHTAPAYDDVTKPAVAPYPAACVSMGERCDCYSQQGTYLRASKDVCLQIVKHGFFVDWQQAQLAPVGNPPPRPASAPVAAPVPQQAAPVINVHVPPVQQQGGQGSDWEQGLAARNAQVRSTLGR
jgi:zona occludens toxin